MGLLEKVMKQGYLQREVRFVGDDNSRVQGFSTRILHELTDGRFTTIRRGALVEMFFEALNGQVESIFGDQITKLTEKPDGISVALQHGGERAYVNLRNSWITLVLFRTRRRMSVQGRKKCEASRSKKPSEGSRWRGGRGPYAN
jgi:2-polyprenyl-6-methoxyphenol hydroxylase-like FAD-dependent oxidoreductase